MRWLHESGSFAPLRIFVTTLYYGFFLLHEPSSPDDEVLSSDKFALIAPCLQQGVSVTRRARETGVHRSTLSRMLARFRKGGSTSLERRKRSDTGSSEVAPALAEVIKAHLIAVPHLSCSTVQRMVERICGKQS